MSRLRDDLWDDLQEARGAYSRGEAIAAAKRLKKAGGEIGKFAAIVVAAYASVGYAGAWWLGLGTAGPAVIIPAFIGVSALCIAASNLPVWYSNLSAEQREDVIRMLSGLFRVARTASGLRLYPKIGRMPWKS